MKKYKQFVFIIVISSISLFLVVQYKKSSDSKECPKLLSVFGGGNLGNQIFEYMSLYAYAKLFKEADVSPYCSYDLQTNLKRIFEKLTLPVLYPKVPKECYDVNKSFIIPLAKRMTLDEVKSIKKPIMLDVYSSKLDEIVQVGMDEIRKEMKFKKENIQYCNKVFKEIKASYNWTNENVTFVGMHYRSSAYNTYLDLVYRNHRAAPDHIYYNKAMSYFSKKYSKIVFILITIDDEWVKNNYLSIKNNNKVVLNPNNRDVIQDFTMLAHCNHSILSYGTFGATAALFNGGITFVYDLNVTTDYKSATVSMILTKLLPNWLLLG